MSKLTVQILCMCCNHRLTHTFKSNEDSAERGATMHALAESKGWHELPAVPGRRSGSTDICQDCWSEIRDGESAAGARAPSVYVQGMEDGEDHCTVCSAALDGEEEHTHQQCFEEGKSLGALDADCECAQQLAARIGCCGGYFHEVLERVPPAVRLPGALWPAKAVAAELIYEHPEVRSPGSITGLYLTVVVPMPADTARFTHEHMMLVKLRCATVQVSIDDNGHTCWSDDGVTCVLCQADMGQGSAHAEAAVG